VREEIESENKKELSQEDVDEIEGEEKGLWVSVMFIIAVILAFIYRLFFRK